MVGIEALAVAVPRRYLAIEDLAEARGIPAAKLTSGLGAREMAIADPGEDTVALAATAASRLFEENAIEKARIGMLVVGTETGVDHSKAVASYVQGLLGLPRSMRTFDTQHACYGGTAALMAACDWIASGSASGRTALVVCSDVARYGIGTPGEPTQGAGAIALLVSEEPDLLALDHGVSGVFSTNVHDFWRPLGRREAMVDGHYSIQCYLDAVQGAFRMWRERAVSRGIVRDDASTSEQLARLVYHVPFCKMAKKAHFALRSADFDGRDDEARATASFEEQVAPSLVLPSRIGNTYTASLYVGLASLLMTDASSIAGKRVGMFSYGSGCSSELFSGVVGERAAEVIARARLDTLLAERTRIDVAEYEQIMSLAHDAPPSHAPPLGTFRFKGVENDRRTYVG
jgi:hydroxymethylglutaryl-CoA synthase